MDPGLQIIEGGFFLALGACLGSFTTALLYRVPRGLPWAWERRDGGLQAVRSQCPTCQKTLTGRELIPLLSWLIQGGRCACRKVRIPARYPLIEGIFAAGALVLWWGLGLNLVTIFLLLAAPFCIVVGRQTIQRQSQDFIMLSLAGGFLAAALVASVLI